MSLSDEMTAKVNAYGAAKVRHDVAAALENCSEDVLLDVVPFRERAAGKAEVHRYLQSFFESFPDYDGEVETIATGNDVVILLWTMRGTMRAPFLGAAPTGRPIAVPAVSSMHFRGGEFCGERVYFDLVTLCEQVGIPLPAFADGTSRVA